MKPIHRLSRCLLTILVALATTGCSAHIHYRFKHMPSPEAPRFVPTVASLTSSLVARGKAVGVWSEPAAIYAARLAAIAQARRTIHFETFFMTPGARADEFAEALAAAARRGVKVRFLADFDGTRPLGRPYWQRLVAAGVEVRFYHPFDWFHPFLYNTRTHRKLLLIDGAYGMTGGTGVSDHWDGLVASGPTAPWCDLEVAFTGPVVAAMEGVFAQHWTYVGGMADMGPEIFRTETDEGLPVLVTPSSPTDGDSPVRALYHASLLAAKKRIWIASPYFLPDRTAREALLAAHRRGLDVRILGVGPKNDKNMIYRACRELYCDLVSAGVPIYEYQPAMMHAKVLLIDDDWVVTGSANFDPRSFFHNDELMVSTRDPALGSQVERIFRGWFEDSARVTHDAWRQRTPIEQAEGQAALLLWWQL